MQCLCFQQSFGSPRCKPHWFSQPNVLGACLSYAGPRVGVADVGFKPLALQRGALCLCYPSYLWISAWELGSLPLLPISMWPFYPLLWKSYFASFQVFSRENCSIGSGSFGVFVGGCELRDIFLCFLIFLKLSLFVAVPSIPSS